MDIADMLFEILIQEIPKSKSEVVQPTKKSSQGYVKPVYCVVITR